MSSNSSRVRILIYAQHLSGVGHYVRTYEIARSLASYHEVFWVEGGRFVPHRVCHDLNIIELPRVKRATDGSISALDAVSNTDDLMQERSRRLLDRVQSVSPHILLIEYYPFSKWELGKELLPVINSIRSQGGKIICSIRDVVPRTRYEKTTNDKYTSKVTTLLNKYFDALLVHGDTKLTRLEDHFSGVDDIEVPIHYTGLVSEKLEASLEDENRLFGITSGQPYVLASVGGSYGGKQLLESLISAWRDPGFTNDRLLVICVGLAWSRKMTQALRENAQSANVIVLPFGSDFLYWLANADLSISQCGYNTASNILETCTPAIVCPNTDMSDQEYRAQRLAKMGLVKIFDPSQETIEQAVNDMLGRPRIRHTINLNGAECSRELLQKYM